jgi:hypothetical protein
MQVEFILNGGVSLVLCPESEAEEALLKQLMKQENDLIEARSSIMIMNKTFRNALVITRKGHAKSALDNNDQAQEESV